MTSGVPDLEVILECGSRRRRLPLVALAATLNMPRATLRAALAGLLFGHSSCDGPVPRLGEPKGVNDRNVSPSGTIGTFPQKTLPSDRSIVLGGDRGEGRPDATAPSVEVIAEVLDDRANLPALRKLLMGCPGDVISAALTETLAVPAARLRRSRAAYFTAAIRRRLASARPVGTPPNLYA